MPDGRGVAQHIDRPSVVTLIDPDSMKTDEAVYDHVDVLDNGAIRCRRGDGVVYHSPMAWHTVDRIPQERAQEASQGAVEVNTGP